MTATFTLRLAPVDAMQECACWSRSLGELGTLCPQHVEVFRLSKSPCWGLACRQAAQPLWSYLLGMHLFPGESRAVEDCRSIALPQSECLCPSQ